VWKAQQLQDSSGLKMLGITEKERKLMATNKKVFDNLVKRIEEDSKKISLWKVRALYHAAILNLDIERIHKVMIFLDWKWGLPGFVPSVEEIKVELYRRLKEVEIAAMDNKHFISNTGGFVVEYDNSEETVSITFVLTDSGTFEDDTNEDEIPSIGYF
jgi:hypothetical protein